MARAGEAGLENMIAAKKLMRAAEARSLRLEYAQEYRSTTALNHADHLVISLEYESGFIEDMTPEKKTLLALGYLNTAICLLKLERYFAAIDACNNALMLKPRDGETLFVLAQACMKLGSYKEALYIFKMAFQINPWNEECVNYMQQCHEILNPPEDEENQ